MISLVSVLPRSEGSHLKYVLDMWQPTSLKVVRMERRWKAPMIQNLSLMAGDDDYFEEFEPTTTIDHIMWTQHVCVKHIRTRFVFVIG